MAVLVAVFGTTVTGAGIYQSLLAIQIFGFTDGQLSIMLLIALFVSVGTSVGVGIVTDQRPSRKVMALCATGALTLGCASVWFLPSKLTFIVTHMIAMPLCGTLFGQIFAVTRLTSAHLPQSDRDGVMAIIRAAFALPFMAILPIWGLVMQSGVPMTTVYPVNTLLALSLVVMIVLWWPADAQAPWTETKSALNFRHSIAEMIYPPLLLRVMLIGIIHSGSAIAGVIIGLQFAEVSVRAEADTGLFFGALVAIEIVFTLLIGQFVRVLPRLQVIALGALTYSVFLFLFPFLLGSGWVWLLTIPAGIGGALVYALAIGYLQDQLGSRAGAGASLTALQRLASDGLSASIFALGTAIAGYWLVGILAGVAMVIATLSLLWVERGRT